MTRGQTFISWHRCTCSPSRATSTHGHLVQVHIHDHGLELGGLEWSQGWFTSCNWAAVLYPGQKKLRHFSQFLAVFPAFFAVFVVFCRFRCFSAVFHPFSLFLTVFHSFSSFFTVFLPFFSTTFSWIFPRIFWIPPYGQDRMGSAPQHWETPNDEMRGSRHSILAKRQNPQILDSACSQDRMGAAPFYPCIF